MTITPNPNDICKCGHPYHVGQCTHYINIDDANVDNLIACFCQHFTQKQSDLGKEGDEKCQTDSPNVEAQSACPAPKANEQVGAKDLCTCGHERKEHRVSCFTSNQAWCQHFKHGEKPCGCYKFVSQQPTPPKISEDEVVTDLQISSFRNLYNLGFVSLELLRPIVEQRAMLQKQTTQLKAENERLQNTLKKIWSMCHPVSDYKKIQLIEDALNLTKKEEK